MSEGMDVTVRLSADTAQYDGRLEKSAGVTTATASAIERASDRARAAWQRELLAQERSEEAAQKAARSKELAALQADILSRSLNAEAESANRSAVAMERAGQAAVTQSMAASAAIRVFDGNQGIRAVEQFLTTIPGVGAALQTIFPIVGAIAFLEIIGKVVGKVEDLYDEFLTLKPLAADVAKGLIKDGDDIAIAWGRTLSTIHATGMRDNPVGTLKNDVTDATETLQAMQQRLAAVNVELGRLNAIRAGGNYLGNGTSEEENDLDIAGQRGSKNKLLAQIDEQQAKIADLQSQVTHAETKAEKHATGSANSADVERLRKMEANLHAMELLQQLSIKDIYDYWEKMRSSFAAGSEAYNQIVAKQATLAEEGTKRFAEAVKHYKDLQRSSSIEAIHVTESSSRATDLFGRDRYEDASSSTAAQKQIEAIQEQAQARLQLQEVQEAVGRTMTKAAAAAQIAAIHTAEYRIELDKVIAQEKSVSSNPYLTEKQRDEQMTKLAEQQTTLVTGRQLQIQSDNYAQNPGDTSYLVGATDALDELAQAGREAAAEMKQFALSSVSKVNSELVKEMMGQGKKGDWRKLGGQVFGSASNSALKQFEGLGLKALGFGGGKKSDGSSSNAALWVRMADGSLQNPAGALPQMGLNKLLYPNGAPLMPNVSDLSGSTMSALGGAGVSALGGESGTRILGGLMENSSGILAKLLGLIHGGSVPSAGMDMFETPGSVPGFAGGGDTPADSLIMVGENGPELMRTGPFGGHVTPNHQLGGAFGSGGDIHYNIDARGTDAALVEERIRHASNMARTQGAAQAVRQTQEHYLRVPR